MKTRFGVETVRNYGIDMRYGGRCGGVTHTQFGHLGAYGTSSADYSRSARALHRHNHLAITPDDVLVDVGSGKGRVLTSGSRSALGNKIVGIELDPQFALPAQRRLARFENVEVICGDALENIPRDATIFYLFNPFGAEVIEEFCDRVPNNSHRPESPSCTTSVCTATSSTSTAGGRSGRSTPRRSTPR